MREKKFDNTNKKEKKVLFVSEFILEKPQGATQSAKAHYESLCELFEKKNIDVVAVDAGTQIKNDEFCCLSGIENRLEKLKNILDGNCTYVSKKIKEYIVQLIYSNNYCAVVFDNSYFGSIIKQIKQLEYIRNIPIIVYFHGVYHNASKQELKKLKFTKKIKYLPNHIALIHNEKLTVRYADKILLLNERDARELKKACKREADFRMPVYFNDSAKIEKKNRIDEIFNILITSRNQLR